MRYLITLDKERGEGVLCTETGIALRYVKTAGADVLSVLTRLTDKVPFNKKRAAIHISYGDRADGTDCDRLEKEIEVWSGEKTEVLCEDRMVHRIYSAFEKDEEGILLYISPDAGAGRLHTGGLSVLGGTGAPVYSNGSAITLSIKTIRAALAAADKTGPRTLLVSLLEEALGLPVTQALREIRSMEAEKIAAYARLAAKGKELGDAVAAAIWHETLTALTQYVHTLSRMAEQLAVKFTETPEPLVPLLIKDLSACLGDRFNVSASRTPILLGGIKRCAEMLSISPDETFIRTFLETYKHLSA